MLKNTLLVARILTSLRGCYGASGLTVQRRKDKPAATGHCKTLLFSLLTHSLRFTFRSLLAKDISLTAES